MNDKLHDESAQMESGALRRIQTVIADSVAAHPDFHAWMDETDPFTASRTELADLMDSAPTDVVKGMLFGIHMMRIQISMVTGRAYE